MTGRTRDGRSQSISHWGGRWAGAEARPEDESRWMGRHTNIYGTGAKHTRGVFSTSSSSSLIGPSQMRVAARNRRPGKRWCPPATSCRLNNACGLRSCRKPTQCVGTETSTCTYRERILFVNTISTYILGT